MAFQVLCRALEQHPSRKPWHHKRSGRNKEFPDYRTVPQQDHHDYGIKIHPVVDRRAQPWNGLLQTNMHDRKIYKLPPKTSDKAACREFLYLVLAHESMHSIVDVTPGDINATINAFKKDGKALREIKDWTTIVPKSWVTVYSETVNVSAHNQKSIAERLNEIILALVHEESHPPKKKQKKTSRIAKAIRKMICMQSDEYDDKDLLITKEKEAASDCDTRSSIDTLPEYKEKVSVKEFA